MERVYFLENNYREEFFSKLRANNFKNWSDMASHIRTSRSMLDDYRSGKLTIPNNKFLILLSLLDKKNKNYFEKLISYKPDNWGAIKGGKIRYKQDPKHLDKIRGIALRNIKIKNSLKLNLPLSEGLCEFLGTFIGDGFFNSYRNGNYLIVFTGHSKLDIDYYNSKIIPIIQNLYYKNSPKPRFIKKGNSMWIHIYSKSLFELLMKRFEFPKGKKCYSVEIPKEIINSEDSFIRATIRGIFDTDGCIYFDNRKAYKRPYPRITFQTTSKKLYLQLKEYLPKHFKIYTRETLKRGFYIEIYGHSQLKKWMSLIGFSNSKHLNKLPK